ncbi:MAG: homoserine kinase [Ekhidna sp.]|nr:homoserine kinase [Ekhidna sp.]MBC6425532.1 homoserine kinase [Ekhidna sp.]
MESVKVYAPASVANVGCGYDTMGFAIDSVGEELILSKRTDSLLMIKETVGAALSSDPEQNVATIAIKALLNALNSDQGFDVSIIKHFKPGSGLGSSASSAAGAVFAANELLGTPFSKTELLPFALEGEAFASGCYHADNVAPSLLGGFQVIRGYDPLDFFEVKVSSDLKVLIVFPDVQVKTIESKGLLPKEVSILTARNQWANTAALVQALNTNDMALLKRAIEDHIAEPVRKSFIPLYSDVKSIAEKSGSVGFNISGSGPSMFSFFSDDSGPKKMACEVKSLYENAGFHFKIYTSKIDTKGCKVIV